MGLRDYSAQERLNKMTVDVVDVNVTISDGSAYQTDDLFFTPQPITVSEVPGQAVIIQSLSVIGASTGGDETGDFDLVICSQNPVLIDSGGLMDPNDPMSGCITTHDNMSAVLGIINITNMIDMGDPTLIGSADNIGIVAKPENPTTNNIFVFGITRSANTWDSPSLKLRFGIVRD
mgnify:CR=1 FL=1|tara:strand:- start:2332 stop:2859 length:528 start_codon:yes stop_codon:yes gene_type:complete